MARRDTPLPGVSYVMPVLNEVTARPGRRRQPARRRTTTGPFEVILALGPSIDGTTELVAEMSRGRPAHPRHRQPRRLDARPG